ncbi:hypothetical protein PR202_ga14485 [Eleusine coracana subsp. coracana]|uniref:FBD domain-containing protein n=1 Tax=Eleusine coracana subsp. coracana TaxID=191504 RepID=A0AAV5CHF4_ELECO|nr:hypothetical protein PR202_ga14485 [Eleusine coracana subsp. coracana]
MEEDDRISRLPDVVLGDIVSLLPTRDGARTQVISSRWRHIWCSAPLNLDLNDVFPKDSVGEVGRILSKHAGPGRRFLMPRARRYLELSDGSAAILDSWLQSPALNNLQELELHYGFIRQGIPPPPLPTSAHRFSSTLRVAGFGGCGGFPDGNNGNALQLPVLKQLSLWYVSISDSSMQALLAGCPVLESLLIDWPSGCSCVRILSHSLRSIGVRPGRGDLSLQQMIIVDASSLERLLLLSCGAAMEMDILVISAPNLVNLGQIGDKFPRLQFGTTVFQGSQLVSSMTVVPSVKVLALSNMRLSLDVVINFMKCFPCLDKLYISTLMAGEKNVWRRKYRNLISTLDIRLKEIVLFNYRGSQSHVNFAKFFVLNARELELMILELQDRKNSTEWIERQHRLLQTRNRVSMGARFNFVYRNYRPGSLGFVGTEIAHDFSTADPFVKFV